MKEFIEKLIVRLEEESNNVSDLEDYSCDNWYGGRVSGFLNSIEIVNQLAEEYKDKTSIIDDLKAFLKEKFKYNSEQAEIWADGSDADSYFRQQKDLYMDRANIYGEVMREIDRLAEEYNSDFCEWKYHRTIDDVPMYETSCYHEFEERFVKKYKFCPYCGKKIKVVE